MNEGLLMFDIGEYCLQGWGSSFSDSVVSIEEDLVSDIEGLTVSAGGSLYLADRYKNGGAAIDLIYPALPHPSLYYYILSPDRARFILSLYPRKSDLSRVNKIVMRPRYIEAGDVELAALYVKGSRTLVLYLTSPAAGEFSGFYGR